MEIRNLYDINRNLCEQTVVKGQPIPSGLRIVCVCTVILNSNNEFLIQKRVPSKNGKFGLTSGHPNLVKLVKRVCLQNFTKNSVLLFHQKNFIFFILNFMTKNLSETCTIIKRIFLLLFSRIKLKK